MTLDLSDPIAVLLAGAEALARAGIEAAAYGGLALAAYGAARETKDADLAVVSTTGADAQAALAGAGVTCRIAFDRVRFGGNRVTRLPETNGAPLNTVDLVEPVSARYARGVNARAVTGTLRAQPIRIVTPEDFVVLKILSTRERDLEDAAVVLSALAGRIDLAFVEREIAELVSEIADHDAGGRWRRASTLAAGSDG